MRHRVLIAGIGNVFLGDDGFGVKVAQRFSEQALPFGTRVVDYGVRSMQLASDLLYPPELLILVDVTRRGEPPGTLYVIDPEKEREALRQAEVCDVHGSNLRSILAAVDWMGGRMPRTRVLACERGYFSEGMHLSAPVRRAVRPAIDLIRRLIAREVTRHEYA
ncbi:MAG TPA: hydrogenase maturation protease [Polyangiaceae bacterium]